MSIRTDSFRLDKRAGKIMGVCAGIADHCGIGVAPVRMLAVLLALCNFGSTLVLYLLVGLLAPARS